jgi:hypothetical protein
MIVSIWHVVCIAGILAGADHSYRAKKLSKTEQIGNLVSEGLDRCRASGYTLATLIHFLDELRANGHPEVDIQRVDFVMRHILIDSLAPGNELRE